MPVQTNRDESRRGFRLSQLKFLLQPHLFQTSALFHFIPLRLNILHSFSLMLALLAQVAPHGVQTASVLIIVITF